ncbi:MAG TPA: DEAD/DEAH box helicase family protein [Saprospiraceae bacterium]|jgi:type I restriction enzyme R subunit|nr:DEAD/DEAH box helicase family protein [Saprospiraceae bacterium]HMT71225.1 DEAD/DEAH box helicase family protein [Saprospiraceae bacterium]
MTFNEDSRVKLPAILHLCRLGFDYLSLSKATWDTENNIFTSIFYESIQSLNPEMESGEIKLLYDKLTMSLDNEDLGKSFYEMLTAETGPRIIDFDNFSKNKLQVVTELPCINGDEEFRPDITLLINGLPLVFIEVKKPNNLDGIQAEYKRMVTRFQNKKFRKFVNLTQMMIFSNNMPYDDEGLQPMQGAFYATTAYGKVKFNFFREEPTFDLPSILKDVSDDLENDILSDNNLIGIKYSPEFITNKNPESPTHKIFNSLFQPERLSFMIRYGLAYVKGENGLEKHIMRYPQLFATKAIENKLNEGVKNGIIWHTQGSGKTALAYFNIKYLTHYFRKRGIVPKFYFIVDRLDLLVQASKEFNSRGLVVHKIQSRDAFVKDLKMTTVIHNSSGKPEITVVNIHKFENDPDVASKKDYNINVQRVYFLDEVHRSYNPKGSFLANLKESDVNAIKIGLTGTPLLGDEYNSRALFGDYIHKYYYNASIADGYTLRLIREEIETNYHFKLKKILEEIDVIKGKSNRKDVYANVKFVEPMLEYIISDFEKFRMTTGDPSIGAMVICDSSEQAEKLKEVFDERYPLTLENEEVSNVAAEPFLPYSAKKAAENKVVTSALILHDAGTKLEREDLIEDFKHGKIDLLFVYNMLLTGFDAPRLKKLYVTRVIKAHNLLQALTRVNRSYKDFRYGYVVDFADIQSEFDKTNRDYFDELQHELGSEAEHYSQLFKTKEEIDQDIQHIQDVLFQYDTANAEGFSQQVSQINDRKKMLELTKALNSAKELYNLIRLSGQYDMLEKLDFRILTILAREANNRLALINAKESLENDADATNLLRVALEDVLFAFRKVSEEEMIIADKLKNTLRRTRETLGGNFDPNDPVFITLREELERMFKKKNLSEISSEEMQENIKALEMVYEKAKELDRKNQLLKAKYDQDAKYARIHKRLMEKDPLTDRESKLFEALKSLKKEIDEQIKQNAHILENESFVERMILRLVISELKNKHDLPLDAVRSQAINQIIVKEYMNEFHGRVA